MVMMERIMAMDNCGRLGNLEMVGWWLGVNLVVNLFCLNSNKILIHKPVITLLSNPKHRTQFYSIYIVVFYFPHIF